MKEKPSGLDEKWASQFKDQEVVKSYKYRPPYPKETFEIIKQLCPEEIEKTRILEIGSGSGDITKGLVEIADEIVCVDYSKKMIEEAKSRIDSDKIEYHCLKVEELENVGEFDLIVAAECIHWMEWKTIFPKLKNFLKPEGKLLLIYRDYVSLPEINSIVSIIQRYSTNDEWEDYDIKKCLENRGFFTNVNEKQTEPIILQQSINGFIESIHSRNGFSKERMKPENINLMHQEINEVLAPHVEDNKFAFSITATLMWGDIS